MKAVAKTNLFLRVLGKRQDSYHDLENGFVPLSCLYDEVNLTPGDGRVSLTIEGGGLPVDNDNLCIKAANAFFNASGCSPDIGITLRKRIPIAAGLGGGSSDAAAVLLLLNERFGFPLSMEQLKGLASKLGADVPFFLNPVPSLGTGIGDELSPIELNVHFALIIVTPCFPLPVKWAFSHLVEPEASAPSLSDFLAAAASDDVKALAAACRNDLEAPIFQKFPLLCMMKDNLMENGALTVHVSGSGPSLFAVSECETTQSIVSAFAAKYNTFPVPHVCVF